MAYLLIALEAALPKNFAKVVPSKIITKVLRRARTNTAQKKCVKFVQGDKICLLADSDQLLLKNSCNTSMAEANMALQDDMVSDSNFLRFL